MTNPDLDPFPTKLETSTVGLSSGLPAILLHKLPGCKMTGPVGERDPVIPHGNYCLDGCDYWDQPSPGEWVCTASKETRENIQKEERMNSVKVKILEQEKINSKEGPLVGSVVRYSVDAGILKQTAWVLFKGVHQARLQGRTATDKGYMQSATVAFCEEVEGAKPYLCAAEAIFHDQENADVAIDAMRTSTNEGCSLQEAYLIAEDARLKACAADGRETQDDLHPKRITHLRVLSEFPIETTGGLPVGTLAEICITRGHVAPEYEWAFMRGVTREEFRARMDAVRKQAEPIDSLVLAFGENAVSKSFRANSPLGALFGGQDEVSAAVDAVHEHAKSVREKGHTTWSALYQIGETARLAECNKGKIPVLIVDTKDGFGVAVEGFVDVKDETPIIDTTVMATLDETERDKLVVIPAKKGDAVLSLFYVTDPGVQSKCYYRQCTRDELISTIRAAGCRRLALYASEDEGSQDITTADPKPEVETQTSSTLTGNIKRERKALGMSRQELGEALGFSSPRGSGIVTKWETGQAEPLARDLFKMADLFKTTMDDLVGRSVPVEVAPKPSTFGEDLRYLINRHREDTKSDTPDYVLVEYLCACMKAFYTAIRSRGGWSNTEACLSAGADDPKEAAAGQPPEPAGRTVEVWAVTHNGAVFGLAIPFTLLLCEEEITVTRDPSIVIIDERASSCTSGNPNMTRFRINTTRGSTVYYYEGPWGEFVNIALHAGASVTGVF